MSDNGNGREALQLSGLQLIVLTATVCAVFVGGMWAVYLDQLGRWEKLRSEIFATFLPKVEHIEFRDSVTKDISTLKADNAKQNDQLLPRREFYIWKDERERSSANTMNAMQRQIDLLNDRINRFSSREDKRHIDVAKPQ